MHTYMHTEVNTYFFSPCDHNEKNGCELVLRSLSNDFNQLQEILLYFEMIKIVIKEAYSKHSHK